MSYLVLARKCRPTRFDEVVGQSHITRTLANAIKMDRVAHGFLFSGVRGVGKTSLARILAKSLNCANGPTDEPCGVCESCKSITAGTAVDVMEVDGASNNSVEDIRELRESVPFRPLVGRYKIFVVDEVHMLSMSAFNALLKTLEEPPPHVKFVFATTEPHKIPMTILSRVQRYDFRRISSAAIVTRIKEILADEGIEAEEAALAVVGREAAGSMRDALSILDQVLAAGNTGITATYVTELLGIVGRQTYFELSSAIIDGKPADCLRIVARVDTQGFDISTFSRGFIEHLRNLVVASVCDDNAEFPDIPNEERDALIQQARSTNTSNLHRLLKHVSDAYDEIARSPFPRILLEAVVARLADMGDIVPASEILARLEVLAQRLSGPDAAALNAPGHQSTHGDDEKKKPENETVAIATPPPARLSSAASKEVRTPRLSSFDASAKTAGTGKGRPFGKSDWEAVLQMLLEHVPAKASILERAGLEENSCSDHIRLVFDSSDSFSVERIQQPDIIKEIESIVSRSMGHPVRLSINLRDMGTPSSLARRRLQEQEEKRIALDDARNHPVVSGVVRALDGKIVTIQLKNEDNDKRIGERR